MHWVYCRYLMDGGFFLGESLAAMAECAPKQSLHSRHDDETGTWQVPYGWRVLTWYVASPVHGVLHSALAVYIAHMACVTLVCHCQINWRYRQDLRRMSACMMSLSAVALLLVAPQMSVTRGVMSTSNGGFKGYRNCTNQLSSQNARRVRATARTAECEVLMLIKRHWQ